VLYLALKLVPLRSVYKIEVISSLVSRVCLPGNCGHLLGHVIQQLMGVSDRSVCITTSMCMLELVVALKTVINYQLILSLTKNCT